MDMCPQCDGQVPGIILCIRPAKERPRYNVTSSLIGWARSQNDPWLHVSFISMVSYQKGPTRHAYAWQIGPFWQDTLDNNCKKNVSINMTGAEPFHKSIVITLINCRHDTEWQNRLFFISFSHLYIFDDCLCIFHVYFVTDKRQYIIWCLLKTIYFAVIPII